MGDTGTAKSKSDKLDVTEEQREGHRTSEQVEQQELRNLDAELHAEEEQKEDGRLTNERNEQQDLNQGMDTGTHASARRGINWGPAYQVRSNASLRRQKKDEPNTKSNEKEKKPTL